MRLVPFLIPIVLCIFTACTGEPPAAVVELDGGAIPTVTPRIVYVTPTQAPTTIPTVEIVTEPPTLAPIQPSATADLRAAEAQCVSTLETLYTQASEFCIGEPAGYFCNGGLAPVAEASENVVNVSNSMAVQGSLVPVDVVESVQTSSLLTGNSGGVIWVRISEPIEINALMLGDVELRDITPADSSLDAWQSLSVITGDSSGESLSCGMQPYSMFVIQGPWGDATSFALNGVSVELTGSIAVQTTATDTIFIALEGQTMLTVFGQNRLIVAGQQLNIPHANGNYSQPSGVPSLAPLHCTDRLLSRSPCLIPSCSPVAPPRETPA